MGHVIAVEKVFGSIQDQSLWRWAVAKPMKGCLGLKVLDLALVVMVWVLVNRGGKTVVCL